MQVLPEVFRQFIAFSLVGIVGTIAHFAVLWILVEKVGIVILLATTAGFVLGAIVNYILNRRFTFTSQSTHVVALPKFLTVAAIGAGINAIVMTLVVENTDIYYLIVQLFATGTVLVWNFFANYVWTFRT